MRIALVDPMLIEPHTSPKRQRVEHCLAVPTRWRFGLVNAHFPSQFN
jgi:hypothetical protein